MTPVGLARPCLPVHQYLGLFVYLATGCLMMFRWLRQTALLSLVDVQTAIDLLAAVLS